MFRGLAIWHALFFRRSTSCNFEGSIFSFITLLACFKSKIKPWVLFEFQHGGEICDDTDWPREGNKAGLTCCKSYVPWVPSCQLTWGRAFRHDRKMSSPLLSLRVAICLRNAAPFVILIAAQVWWADVLLATMPDKRHAVEHQSLRWLTVQVMDVRCNSSS